MTSPKDDFPTPEQLNEQASVALSNLSYNMGLLLGTVSRLEHENANLKSTLYEAKELLRRGREYADDIDLDVGWQMDVDMFIEALNSMDEPIDLERHYTARELMRMPRERRDAILKKASEEAAEYFNSDEFHQADEEYIKEYNEEDGDASE